MTGQLKHEGGESRDDMQQRAVGWHWARGCNGRDTASTHGAPAPPTELLNAPCYHISAEENCDVDTHS